MAPAQMFKYDAAYAIRFVEENARTNGLMVDYLVARQQERAMEDDVVGPEEGEWTAAELFDELQEQELKEAGMKTPTKARKPAVCPGAPARKKRKE